MKVYVQIGRQFNKNSIESKIQIDMPEGSNVLDLCNILITKFQYSESICSLEDIGGRKDFTNFIILNNKLASPSDLIMPNDKVVILPIIIGG